MFINIPENYSSAWCPLEYYYKIDSPEDLTLEIVNSDNDEVLVVKKFYSCDSIKIDISRIVRQKIIASPAIAPTGFAITEGGFIRVRLSVNGQTSATRVYTLAKNRVEPPITLTTMPNARILGEGECDSIVVATTLGKFVKAKVVAIPRNAEEHNTQENTFATLSQSKEFHVFTINANDYNVDYQSVDVIMNFGSENEQKIHYSLSSPREKREQYRVAWLSTAGSIERYTFPVVDSTVRLKDGAVRYSLRSAYGTADEVEALSEIVSSSKVWHITSEGESLPVEVTTTEVPIFAEGALMVANIEVEEYDKGNN